MISPDFEPTIRENCGLFGLSRARRLAEQLQPIVGSQIELHFACMLASWIEGIDASYVIIFSEEEATAAGDFYIWPQRQIGKYRVDFVVGRAAGRALIVECDGREFHHATRAQIERDRARDSELSAAGWKVFRYPGTQIHKDPWGAAAEVIDAVDTEYFRSWYAANMRFIK